MSIKKKVLFICTGNACRSQIAHGLFRELACDQFEVFSAGSHPSHVHPMSIMVMEEIGIDISDHTSDHVDDYLDQEIDIAITVCDKAKKACPLFSLDVERIHWSIDDPFRGWSFDTNQMNIFRKTRTEIQGKILEFLKSH